MWKYAALVLSAIGIVDAGYLSYTRFTDTSIDCGVILEGCNIVAASPYSVLFGILPLAYLGLAFYIAIFIVSILLIMRDRPNIRLTLFVLTLGGFLASLYFVYVQTFLIKAYCIYCLLSAITSTFLFIVGIIIYKRKESQLPEALVSDENLGG